MGHNTWKRKDFKNRKQCEIKSKPSRNKVIQRTVTQIHPNQQHKRKTRNSDNNN